MAKDPLLTLRQATGGGNTPLEDNLKLLENGAPAARHVSAQLLKYPYRLFGTSRHPPPTSGGSVPPRRRPAAENTAEEDLLRILWHQPILHRILCRIRK